MRNLSSFLLLLLTLLFSNFSFSQEYNIIQGKVLDSASGKPVPFVNIIVVKNKQHGGMTDLDGSYSLKVPEKVSQVRFSCVGYQNKVFSIKHLKKQSSVRLVPKNIKIEEVVVTPKANPAIPVIKKAIQNREENAPMKQHDAFSFKSYNKYVYKGNLNSSDSTEIDTTKSNNSIIDTSTNQVNRHIFLMESITRSFYRNSSLRKEIVLGQKVSGLQKPRFPVNSPNLSDISFYRNYINLLQKEYRSPVSPGALNKYQYQMKDTIVKNSDTIFLIRYFPQNGKSYRALEGIMGIHKGSYGLTLTNASPSRQSLIHAQINQIHNKQDSFWFPKQLNMEVRLTEHNLGWKITNYVKDLSILSDLSHLERKDLNIILP